MEYIQMIKNGDPVMMILLGCSVVAVFIFVEKWFQFHRSQVNVKELVNGLINVLKRDGMIEAITLCDHTPGPVARLLTAAIQAHQNDDDIRQSIEDASIVELPRLESHLNILATIAYIAPLLGLLGTVVGMADAFQAIETKQGISMTLADLSGGIYLALTSAAAGLCVAIPCHIAYNYLVSRVQSLCVDMEKASSEILYFFQHHTKSELKK
ncbi:MAG: MotA/TolQ/ExbB proton channel family protein [Victivallales bacterium]|jgi:motA/tolQ/exbB proton channel